jgi:hypothetical protein
MDRTNVDKTRTIAKHREVTQVRFGYPSVNFTWAKRGLGQYAPAWCVPRGYAGTTYCVYDTAARHQYTVG